MVNTIHNFMDTRRIRTSSYCIANMALQPLVDASTLGFISHESSFPSGIFLTFPKSEQKPNIKNLYQVRGIFVPLRMERRLFEPQSVMMSEASSPRNWQEHLSKASERRTKLQKILPHWARPHSAGHQVMI